MEKKITLKERFEEMANIFAEMGREDLKNFCLERIDLINKKANAPRKAKTISDEDTKLQNIIIEVLSISGNAMGVAELRTTRDELRELNSSKVTGLLNRLIANGEVEKTNISKIESKKKYVYAIVEKED